MTLVPQVREGAEKGVRPLAPRTTNAAGVGRVHGMARGSDPFFSTLSGAPVQIHISPNDGVPIYLQIVNQVKYQVASGRLAPGVELPPSRRLAERVGGDIHTV